MAQLKATGITGSLEVISGYITGSITGSDAKFSSLTGSLSGTATALASMNISQFTNDAGYATGGSSVATAVDIQESFSQTFSEDFSSIADNTRVNTTELFSYPFQSSTNSWVKTRQTDVVGKKYLVFNSPFSGITAPELRYVYFINPFSGKVKISYKALKYNGSGFYDTSGLYLNAPEEGEDFVIQYSFSDNSLGTWITQETILTGSNTVTADTTEVQGSAIFEFTSSYFVRFFTTSHGGSGDANYALTDLVVEIPNPSSQEHYFLISSSSIGENLVFSDDSLSYIPSTSTLKASKFSGSFEGDASGLRNIPAAPFSFITSSSTLSTEENIVVDATLGDVTLDLQNLSNKKFFIKKIDNSSNSVTVNGPFVSYSQETFLTSSNANFGDDFGYGFESNGVSIDDVGETIIVGSPFDEIGASSQGLAYVFKKQNSSWVLDAVLSGSYALQSSDFFGASVFMGSTGDLAIVGAPNDEAAGISSAGIAYVFRSSSLGWFEEQALTGSFAIQVSDNLGRAVCISKDLGLIAVGAFQDEISPNGSSSGVVYLYRSGSSGWYEEKAITGSFATQTSDNFGTSIDINSDGTKVIVGAKADEQSLSYSSTGVAYLFESSSINGWAQTQWFTGSYAAGSANTFDAFGSSVSITSNGDLVCVGAVSDEAPGTQNGSGLVYVFRSGSSGWYEEAVISGSQATQSADNFGKKVTLNSSGTLLFVSAQFDEEPGAAISERGLCYVFYSSSNGWQEKQYFSSSVTFGSTSNVERIDSHAINGNGTVVVTGVRYADITQANDAGMAYVFTSSLTNPLKIDGKDTLVLDSENQAVTLISDESSNYYIQSLENAGRIKADTISYVQQQFINLSGQYGDLSPANSVYVISASADGGVTLPLASENKGLMMRVFRIDSENYSVYVSASSGDTIGGSSNPKNLMGAGFSGQYGWYTFISLGEYGWAIV